MGLINRRETDGFYSPYIESYSNNIEQVDNHLLESSTDDEEPAQNNGANRQQRSARRVIRQNISVSQENLSNSSRRKTGVRRTRRLDNLRYLLNMEEKEEEFAVNNASTQYEPSSSLFEDLLDDPDKMKAWNNFVESSEEEQNEILNYRGLHDIQEEEEMESEVSCEESWTIILDKRSDHPAYSPKQCYNRVDRNLRSLLKKRQLPLGILANLERELVTFFCDCPDSVFVSHITNGYERMLLHALCQYLCLYSRSYDDEGGRKTQVENKHGDFRPPSLLLTEYLQQHQNSL